MFPGPVSKAINFVRPRARRNRRQIRNAADILQNAPALGIGKQNIVEQRNERRALSAGQHIGRPKIRNHGNAERGSNRLRLARLPRAGKSPPAYTLPRAADGRASVHGSQPGRASPVPPRRLFHCLRIRQAQPPVQPRQLRRRSRLRIHRRQHRAPQRGREGETLMRQQRELRPAGYPTGKSGCPILAAVAPPLAVRRAGFLPPGWDSAIRTTATSIPSADVPLITPATVIARAFMRLRHLLTRGCSRNPLAEPQNPRPQRLKLPLAQRRRHPRAKHLRPLPRRFARPREQHPSETPPTARPRRSAPHTRCRIGSA